jgi:hypothetical protein
MSKSPLSGAFSGSSEPAKKKNKKNGAILLIAGIALTSSIGGVFASTAITLNSGGIEFGQGTATTNVCDATLSAQLTQTWNNAAGGFQVEDVIVGGIGNACATKTLRVGLLDSSGTAQDTFTIVNPSTTIHTEDVSSRSPRISADVISRVVVTSED